jgi:O-antigen/teichoic acid export membrane protein
MAPARTHRAEGGPTHEEPELSTQDIGRRAASGVALLTAKGMVGQALGLVSTIVVSRLLPPSQLGLFAIALTVSSLLWMLSGGVGLAGALIRRPAAPDRADLRAYVALQLMVTVVLVVVVSLATLPFGLIGRLTAVMVATAPITAFRGASVVVLERQLLYKRLATAETVELVAYYAWTIATVAIGWGLWGLATATVVRSIVGTVCVLALAPTGIVLPLFDRSRIRSMAGMGARVQVVDFVAAIRDQILVIGTAAIGSVSIVAYWSLVLRALQAPALLLSTQLRVSFPAMSRTRSAGGDPTAMLRWLLSASTILAGTLLAPLAGAAPALVPFLFGARWSPAADALTVACLALVIHTPVMIAGQSYLWTAGDSKSPLRAILADAVVVLTVGLSLVPFIGVLGLAISGVVAAIVHSTILARVIDRQTQIHVFRQISTPVLAWVVAAGVAWACAEGPGSLLLRTAVSSLVAIGVYLGLLFVTRRALMLELIGTLQRWIRRALQRHRSIPAPVTTNAQV